MTSAGASVAANLHAAALTRGGLAAMHIWVTLLDTIENATVASWDGGRHKCLVCEITNVNDE